MTKYLLALVFTLALAKCSYDAFHIWQAQKEIERDKQYFADLNKVNYGLFNLQLWKQQAFDIFSGHISQFQISPKAFVEAEKELNLYLMSVYEKYIVTGKAFEKVFEEAEKNPKMNKMILKLLKDNLASQIKELNLPKHIPGMASNLAKELKNNEPRFKQLMQQELQRLMQYQDKYAYKDPRQPIYAQYTCDDLACTNAKLQSNINQANERQSSRLSFFFIEILIFITALGLLFSFLGQKVYITFLTLISMCLLFLGVTLPMINIDARLNSVSFNLYESDIVFEEQIVFYQSKSILDVTQTLIDSKGFDLKIVGIMILCFSVIFPLIKLVLSMLYLIIDRLKNNRLVRGMIFHLGKWSMADVFVVALFMAYIGFFGLFGNQLAGLERNRGGFAIETVNRTELSPGAYLFVSYCILSIFIGVMINKWDTSKLK